MKPRKGFSEVRPADLEVGDTIYVAKVVNDVVLKSNTFKINYLEDGGYLVYFGNGNKYMDLGCLAIYRKDK